MNTYELKISNKYRRLLRIIMTLLAIFILLFLIIDAFVVYTVKGRILTLSDSASLVDLDCVLILGAGVEHDNTPSPMLKDRLDQGIALYYSGITTKLLMSGDHGQSYYDEVNVMKQYAINAGIDSSKIFMDHAGFSTYESIYRAQAIFGVKKIVIVSQSYHLSRALFIANRLGIEAYGIATEDMNYAGQFKRDIRETFARNKDFLMTIFKPEPTFLGESISILGNGDQTND